MFSLSTETQLAQHLLKIAAGERDVELSRQSLSEHYAFDPYTALRSLDRLGLGNISSLDLKDWLDRSGHYTSELEAYLVIKQYDANNDSRLSLNEFLQLVLPSTSPSLRQRALSRASTPLTLDVQFALNRLLEKEVTLQRDLEYARRDLGMKHDWDMLAAFRTIDRLGLSYIDRGQLQDFLLRHSLSSYLEDVDAILRRLDVDADGRLSYTEFVEGVLAAEPRKYASRDYSYSSPRRSYSRSYLRASSPLRQSLASSSPYRVSHDLFISSACIRLPFSALIPFSALFPTKVLTRLPKDSSVHNSLFDSSSVPT
jgi:Ca2+-binding EF-hand superfamily protein